ncbi:MAG: exodeoxyribonuclease VII large subunit, partial [Vibrio sp.]
MSSPARNPSIYTVSRLNAEVRLLLENEMGIVWLIGEISNFSAPVSGHWYLTLKDSQAQVKCAMFKGNNRLVNFKPQNGQQVLVKARLSLYEPRGDYQIILESMQPEGDGRLQQQFEQLKMQLAAEGLFAQSRKQALPEHPRCVGIITSRTGAALHDILQVLKRRDPQLPVIIYPTLVQGEEAALQIAQAIGRANSRAECDVLIVGRGGGSLEDLWCFNHEIVARTIAASQIPIISAVGHEVDVTIADFVADMRAPTPSAAAELVSRDQRHKQQLLGQWPAKLASAMRHYLAQQHT